LLPCVKKFCMPYFEVSVWLAAFRMALIHWILPIKLSDFISRSFGKLIVLAPFSFRFVMTVRLSAWKNSAPTWWIFLMKFGIL
jgi:hypothetical protein